MGIITLVLVLSGQLTEFKVPFWVILTCATAITLGILSGGWRIVRTVGFGIYKVRPIHALDTQLTSAAVIYGASVLGAPVSTTHVVSSSIMGIGTARPRQGGALGQGSGDPLHLAHHHPRRRPRRRHLLPHQHDLHPLSTFDNPNPGFPGARSPVTQEAIRHERKRQQPPVQGGRPDFPQSS
jgi:hypothetical protein